MPRLSLSYSIATVHSSVHAWLYRNDRLDEIFDLSLLSRVPPCLRFTDRVTDSCESTTWRLSRHCAGAPAARKARREIKRSSGIPAGIPSIFDCDPPADKTRWRQRAFRLTCGFYSLSRGEFLPAAYTLLLPRATHSSMRHASTLKTYISILIHTTAILAVVKVRGARGGSAPLLRLWWSLAPLLESEPSLPTAGPKLLNSTKNHNVRCRINKF